jgi:hypothetical protein
MVAVSVGQPTQRPYVKIFEGAFSPFEAALRARPTLDSVLLRRNGWTSLCRDNSALYSGLPREMNPLSSRSPKRGWDFTRESLKGVVRMLCENAIQEFWSRSYICSTAENLSNASIERYIAEQNHLSRLFLEIQDCARQAGRSPFDPGIPQLDTHAVPGRRNHHWLLIIDQFFITSIRSGIGNADGLLPAIS